MGRDPAAAAGRSRASALLRRHRTSAIRGRFARRCVRNESSLGSPARRAAGFRTVPIWGSLQGLTSCRQPGSLSRGGCNRCLAMILADVDAFGADERDVRDAEEAENAAQVRLLVTERRRGRVRTVESAARGRDDDLLATRQSLWALLGIAERLARDREPVNPCLELRRDREVVHRCADHDHLGVEKILERLLAPGQILPQGRAFRENAPGGGEMRACERADRFRTEIVVRDDGVGTVLPQPLDDRSAQLTADGAFPKNAGVDVQDFHGGPQWWYTIVTEANYEPALVLYKKAHECDQVKPV